MAWGKLLGDLRTLRGLILRRQGTAALVTSEDGVVDRAASAMEGLLSSLPMHGEAIASTGESSPTVQEAFGSVVRAGGNLDQGRLLLQENALMNDTSSRVARGSKVAVLVPSQVSYVVRQIALPLDGQGGVTGLRTGAAMVGSSLASSNWIWDQVRVLGNAYGAGMGFDQMKGVVGFSTYRDPNIKSTFE